MRTILLILIIISMQLAQPNYPKTAENAQFVFDDVALFLKVYNELEPSSDTLSILEKNYLDKGSMGLKEFIKRFNLNSSKIKKSISENKIQYEKLAKFYENKDDLILRIRKAYSKLHKVLPNAMFPPTYFIVGEMNSIGQASRYGQLLSVTKIIEHAELIERLAVHELAHFQNAMKLGIQKYQAIYQKKDNMLDICIREGIAEFITYLSLNKITQENSLEFFNRNSDNLKQRFKKDLETQNSSYWLYESLKQNEDPKLLGYVMGFKICQTYYENAENKEEAIKTLLTLQDVDHFYTRLKW